MEKKRAIICVDDEVIILMSLKQELTSYFKDKYVFEVAMTPKKALEIIEDLYREGISIGLIITDWLMPGMKGDDFLLEVGEKYKGIKSIIISGHADDEAIDNIKEKINLQAFIQKPWSKSSLIEAIEKSLES